MTGPAAAATAPNLFAVNGNLLIEFSQTAPSISGILAGMTGPSTISEVDVPPRDCGGSSDIPPKLPEAAADDGYYNFWRGEGEMVKYRRVQQAAAQIGAVGLPNYGDTTIRTSSPGRGLYMS